MIMVGLFAGAVVDRVDRRRLIIVAQALLMLSAFVLAALTWAGMVRVEYVIFLAAFNGLVSSFDMPGRQAFVVEMVGREDLPNAIAMNSMIFNGARMVGPAVAGILIAIIGVSGCFLLNGISYLAVIWSLLEMELPRRVISEAAGSMFRRVREGLHYVWHHPPSLYLMILVAISSGFGMQYTVLIPVFAKNLLHSGASWLRLPDGRAGARRGRGRDRDELARLDASRIATEPRVRDVLHRRGDFRLRGFALDADIVASRRCSSARA